MHHSRLDRLTRASLLAAALATAIAGVASSASAAASRPAKPPAACPTGTWHKLPITVTRHVHVPPTPVIEAVRTAPHRDCGYDRIVFVIAGKHPGYTIRYVAHVINDASGQPIKLPGKRFVLITLRPAQAHKNSGGSTLPTKVQVVKYPMLRSWVLAGDFEGVVSIGIGLRSKTSVR